jgi:CubicO group peptidase (beta-lactamase class C family)
MRYNTLIAFTALFLAQVAATAQESLPNNRDFLSWSLPERDVAFRQMEKVFPTRTVKAAGTVHAFEKGEPLPGIVDAEGYMASQRAAGLIIVQDNKIRLEKYGLGFDASGRWTSFSVAKAFTSTLAGVAVRDGHIKSIDDKVTVYIPGLKGSVYEDVTVRQLLTMTSGVKWNEEYSNPQSDFVLETKHQADPGMDVTVSYMRRLKREAPAGEKWLYKTGETNLLGVLVSHATGRTLSAYLSEKIWKPYGMEQSAI